MRRTTVVLAALVLLLTGCAALVPTPSATVEPGPGKAVPRFAPASSAVRDTAFPGDTLQDWRTYADRVVRVHVDSAARRTPSEEEVTLGRTSDVRMVTWTQQAVLWANTDRPDADSPATFTTFGGRYTSDRDDARAVRSVGGEPLLVAGHTYLAVLSRTSLSGSGDEPAEWIPLAVLPFDRDTVGDGERYRGWQGQEETLDALWGRTGAEVTARFEAEPIDPYAAPYASEDAAQKWQHAAAGR